MRASISHLNLVIRQFVRFLGGSVYRNLFPQTFQISPLGFNVNLCRTRFNHTLTYKCLEISIDRRNQKTLIIVAVCIFANIIILDRRFFMINKLYFLRNDIDRCYMIVLGEECRNGQTYITATA